MQTTISITIFEVSVRRERGLVHPFVPQGSQFRSTAGLAQTIVRCTLNEVATEMNADQDRMQRVLRSGIPSIGKGHAVAC